MKFSLTYFLTIVHRQPLDLLFFSTACSGASLNFSITTDAFSHQPVNKCSRLFHPQTNQSKTQQIPPSCALLALPSSPSFLKVPCLHYLYFLTSLIPNSARSAFHLTTPLKLLFQELPHLRSEVWKLEAQACIADHCIRRAGSQQALNTLLLLFLEHLFY